MPSLKLLPAREYVVGTSPEGRTTITLLNDQEDIPFNVWRDVGRLAGKSYSRGVGSETFEFLVPDNIDKAKDILSGALWKEKT